ncbi:MAG TPA: dethiobiotin synthase [Burkholderiales bacterium]|nr:dethiobiotin synthase [Burkholderiales bacterium]
MKGEGVKGVFVTGIDTGVGKTLFTCALLHAYAQRGLRAVGMKPVAAGATVENGVLVNEDVIAMRAAGNVDATLDLVNPYCFEPPIAPHIAAAQKGVTIDLERIASAYAGLAALADRVVVEGAGGFRVPLGPGVDTADLARRLALPVVIVVGMRLGCLNHALLTADAVRASGLHLAGWVASHVDADMMYAEDNVEALKTRLRAPLVARIPHTRTPEPASIAHYVDSTRIV